MGLIEIVIVTLIIIWIGGLLFHIAGAFIHILLAVAIVLIVARLLGVRF